MKRRGASLFAVGLIAGVQLLVAAPAHAVPPSVEWTTPGPSGTVGVNGFTFAARVHTSRGTLTNNITVGFSSSAGRPVPAGFTRTPGSVNSYPITQQVSFPWNGSYSVRITASAKDSVLDGDTTPRNFDNGFVVDAAPTVPTNVRATADSKRVVTVAWNANTEPDMAGYEVIKQSSSGAWNTFVVTGGTSVTDESTANKGGTYNYQVRALRQSAQAGKLNPSLFSSTASATVAAPPVQTTPTTQPPAGSGGEEGATDEESGRSGPTGGSNDADGSPGGSGDNGSGTEAEGGSGGGRRSGAPALGTSGKVDLSDFASLLEQSRSQGAAAGADGEDREDDGTFDGNLPFKARAGGQGGDEGEDGEAIGDEPASEGNGNLQALGFLAGGLLATVLAMHVLWVRSEVHRAEALEALAPESREPVGAEARFGVRDQPEQPEPDQPEPVVAS